VLADGELAKLHPDARQQHADADRLGHVVVGARLEPEDDVRIGIVRRQHDDRHLYAAPPDHAAQLAPVDVGQSDIEQNNVRPVVAENRQRLGAVRRRDGHEVLMDGELLGQGLAQRVVVVDDQYPVAFGRMLTPHLVPLPAGDGGRASLLNRVMHDGSAVLSRSRCVLHKRMSDAAPHKITRVHVPLRSA
jgi:hypothetical protein